MARARAFGPSRRLYKLPPGSTHALTVHSMHEVPGNKPGGGGGGGMLWPACELGEPCGCPHEVIVEGDRVIEALSSPVVVDHRRELGVHQCDVGVPDSRILERNQSPPGGVGDAPKGGVICCLLLGICRDGLVDREGPSSDGDAGA